MALANRALFGSRFEENNRPGIEMNVDGSMEVVLPDGTRAPLDGSGGGALVGCTLVCDSLDVRTGPTTYPILWNDLIDNLWDYTSLPAIPDGLGLDFEFDGTPAPITVTEAGVFAMTLNIIMISGEDATWRAYTNAGGYLLGGQVLPALAEASVSGVGILPVGAEVGPQVITSTSATSDPWNIGATLQLVRLGGIT